MLFNRFRAQAVDDVEPVLDTSPWPSVLEYLSITGLPSVNLEPPPIESAPESSLSTRADVVDRLRQCVQFLPVTHYHG